MVIKLYIPRITFSIYVGLYTAIHMNYLFIIITVKGTLVTLGQPSPIPHRSNVGRQGRTASH